MKLRKADLTDIDQLLQIRKIQLQDEGQRPDTDMDGELRGFFRDKMRNAELVEWVAEDEADISLEGLHVLIAEDMELNAEVLTDLLEMEDITSEWAENGQRAAELFEHSEEGHFSAILMDMRMPVMDGLAATRRIRQLERPDAALIPIIALTANAFEEDVKSCLEAGMNAHMSKPVDIEQLKKVLGRMLAK